MRPYQDVLAMWCQYDDRELQDWQWRYERMLRSDPRNKHVEYLLQDYNSISQLLRERNIAK